jgi:hypothetical protein
MHLSQLALHPKQHQRKLLIASSLSPHGHHNSTYWILSINHTEFSTAEAAAGYISSSQLPNTTTTIIFILALRQDSTRSKYADNRAIFNQIRLSYHNNTNNIITMDTTNNIPPYYQPSSPLV